jgi:hypothetical protein
MHVVPHHLEVHDLHPVSRHSSRQDTVDDVVQVPRRHEEEATLDRPGRHLNQGFRRDVAWEVAHACKDGNERADLSRRTSSAKTGSSWQACHRGRIRVMENALRS